jgi:hypothetical protein
LGFAVLCAFLVGNLFLIYVQPLLGWYFNKRVVYYYSLKMP